MVSKYCLLSSAGIKCVNVLSDLGYVSADRSGTRVIADRSVFLNRRLGKITSFKLKAENFLYLSENSDQPS